MLVIHAVFPIAPERREEALELVEELVEQSNREEGVVEYRATWDVSDPNVLRFFEQYEDEDAFVTHGDTEHFATFEEALPGLLAGEPEVTRFDVESATELDL
jgi:quinol monooxygenase YgiN